MTDKTITDPIKVALNGVLGNGVLGNGVLGAFHINVSFTAPGMGVTALFGPSGSGKTSILRAIAGLTRLSGLVKIGDDVWQDQSTFIPVYKRPIGYVFQEANLFAHLSVRRNLTYGMSKQRREHSPHFDEVVDILGISHLIDRSPHHLSGGERQRVAIGRALLSDPTVLMMDEPLAALDRTTRNEILPFLERLRDRLNLPIFYITHDMHEVERLADRLVLLESGKVLKAGPLEELQADPLLPLAQSREAAVTLHVNNIGHHDGLLHLQVQGGTFLAPDTPEKVGKNLRLRIAAHDVSLVVERPQLSSILNILPARILSMQDLNAGEMLIVLGLGEGGDGAHILSRISRYSQQRLKLTEGAHIYAQIKGVAIIER